MGGIYKNISTSKNISKLPKGRSTKPKLKAEIVENYQEVEVLNQN